MNFEFGEEIIPSLEKFDFVTALAIAEKGLAKLPHSPFHAILGRSLLHEAEALAEWIGEFYWLCSVQFRVRALYYEMNGFDINTDCWFVDGFAYDADGGMRTDTMDWLTDYQTSTAKETGNILTIEGYEALQVAFETFEKGSADMQDARDWCEQIVIARFMELMRAAHVIGKEGGAEWAAVPIYFTTHDYDFIVRSVF